MNEYQRYGDYSRQELNVSDRPRVGSAILFTAIGAGIGATVALLLTPRTGHDLRDAITRGYRKTVNDVSQRTRDLRDRGSNLLGFNREASSTSTPEVKRHYGQG
jgi:gas vesicle protein